MAAVDPALSRVARAPRRGLILAGRQTQGSVKAICRRAAAKHSHFIAEQAQAERMRSQPQSGRNKVKLGLTSREEVLAVTNE